MQIAPGVSADNWIRLNLNEPESPDWAVAISILEGRITERFITPVDFLITSEETRPPIQRRFGFAVLAIDCLLIETLQAFIDGIEDTNGKSKATFCKFLRTRRSFSGEFRSDDLAQQFYYEFRCGILHQAEIGGESKVWSVGPLLQFENGRIIVNRNKFHEGVKNEFNRYFVGLFRP